MDIASLFGARACVVCLCPRPCGGTGDCWLSKVCAERRVSLYSVAMPPRDWIGGLRGLSEVWNTLGRPLVHTNGRRGNLTATILRGTSRRFRFVTTVHGLLGLHDKRNVAHRVVDLVACRAAEFAIAVSADTARRLLAAGLSRDRVVCVPNGLAEVDLRALLDVARSRETLLVEARTFRIGFLGRLSSEKGVHTLLWMARRLAEEGAKATWMIAGDGPQREWLVDESSDLATAGVVRVLGEITDVRSFLAGTDVLVMPSANEGLPYAMLEAMAAGCAVAAYGVGGVAEVISDPSLGCIAEPGDYLALEGELRRLIVDPAKARALGDAASLHVQTNFALDSRKGTMEKLYHSASTHLGHA